MASKNDHILVYLHPVLDVTFSYLSVKSLHCAAHVCRAWRNAVERELKKRCWCASALIDTDDHDVEVSEKQLAGMLFNDLRMRPTLVLLLTSSDNDVDHDDESSCWEISQYLPRNCLLLSAAVGGVIGNQMNQVTASSPTTNKEVEFQNAASLLCLNPSASIDFQTFIISSNTVGKMRKRDVDIFDLVDDRSNTNIPDNEHSVVLLFATFSRRTRNLIERMKDNSAGKKVIAIGGYTDNVKDARCENVSITKGIMGVWFHGEKLLATLYVHSSNSMENLSSGLENMKEEILKKADRAIDWRKSLMFTVMCVERGADYYDGRPNVESSVVQEVFPGISMFGFFGHGEIGFDSERLTEYKRCNFQLTSLFVLVNYA